MDHSKTLYEWRQERLIPVKQIILSRDEPDEMNSKVTFEYYENPGNDIDGLELKFEEPCDDDNKKQQQLWNHFFDEQ